MDSSTNNSLPFPSLPKDENERDIKRDQATRVLREKIKGIHGEAPSASQEMAEIKKEKMALSEHQQFISDLNKSGKTLPEIQTAWHNYYIGLSDTGKNEVWREFYDAHKLLAPTKAEAVVEPALVKEKAPKKLQPKVSIKRKMPKLDPELQKTISQIKGQIISKIESRQPSKWRAHGRSLLFGLSTGVFVLVILLFGFFNDRFIAPFITPSRNVSAQSIILNPDSIAPSPNPMIIIPKINVEIPVNYSVPTINENDIETGLESGVVHYPTTPYPGQNGNGVIFGHSSNNILNPGNYKFAFVLLHDLTDGDVFYLEYNSKVYVYQVYHTQVVSPNDTSVLNTQSKPATMTLITCDPPGTSINRLVVVGQQISPDPSTNTSSTADQNSASKPTVLPSNSPSLWSRLTSDL